jgi:hypothetical protein
MKYDIIGGGYDQEDEYQESYTIGKLLEELDNSTANSVRLIGTDYTLGSLMSWRGSYDIPAFDYEVGYKTPRQLAEEIRASLKETHYGYKGGRHMYNENDIFYVAAHGTSSEYQVVDVKTEQSILYLCTKIVPY